MSINLISFGFKFGIPQNIDLLLDVRFLPNPNFVPALKAHKGTDREVQDFVLEQPAAKDFLERSASLLYGRGKGIPDHWLRLHRGKAPLTCNCGEDGRIHPPDPRNRAFCHP
jgi:hypothetical protein